MSVTDSAAGPAGRHQNLSHEPFEVAQNAAANTIRGALWAVARRVAVAWREHRTLAAVASLDDHALKDIGVSRSELPHLARETAENPGLDYRAVYRI